MHGFISLVLLFGIAASTTWIPDIVQLPNGVVKGLQSEKSRFFKGIPYAAPPTGDLRWRSPQPHAKWDGEYYFSCSYICRYLGRYGLWSELLARAIRPCHYQHLRKLPFPQYLCPACAQRKHIALSCDVLDSRRLVHVCHHGLFLIALVAVLETSPA